MMEKVTIAIPVYDDEKYIREAVDSALKQDYSNIEVLVVDDCSTDSTFEILKSYGDKITVFRNKKNKGIAFNRNECIRKASGSYLFFLSSDDYYNSGKFVSKVMEINLKTAMVFTSYKVVDEIGNEKGKFTIPTNMTLSEVKVHAWVSALKDTMFCNYSTVSAPLSFWRRNMFDESYNRCEDLEHFLRVLIVNKEPLMGVDIYDVSYRSFEDMGTNRIRDEIPAINKKTISKILGYLEEK